MSSRVISCLSYPGRGHWDFNHITYHVRLLPEFWGCKLRLSLATSPAYREFNLMFFKPTLPAGPFPTPQGTRERLDMVSNFRAVMYDPFFTTQAKPLGTRTLMRTCHPQQLRKKKKVLRKESDKGCRNNSVSKMLALKTQGPECDPQNPWKKRGAAEKWLSR